MTVRQEKDRRCILHDQHPEIFFKIPIIRGQNLRTGALVLPLLEELLRDELPEEELEELELELLLPDPVVLRKKPPALVPLLR